MRKLTTPSRKEISLSGVLYALSDPIRIEIVKRLALKGEQTCGAFCDSVAKSTLSHHFKVLRETGVITMRAEGASCKNSLRRKDLDSRFPGLLDAVLRASKPL
jgi:DNA-binding transcriptional ArsR family regulator